MNQEASAATTTIASRRVLCDKCLGLILLSLAFASCQSAPTKNVEAAPILPQSLHANASPTPSGPNASIPKKTECDNDDAPAFDCSALALGSCEAAKHYACPVSEKRRPGTGFRRKVAAKIGECFASLNAPGDACFKATEACVRRGVREASCADERAKAECDTLFAGCSSEHKVLCAKLLSALEPGLRKESTEFVRQWTKGGRKCAIAWDLPGFPFCPFCGFDPSRE